MTTIKARRPRLSKQSHTLPQSPDNPDDPPLSDDEWRAVAAHYRDLNAAHDTAQRETSKHRKTTGKSVSARTTPHKANAKPAQTEKPCPKTGITFMLLEAWGDIIKRGNQPALTQDHIEELNRALLKTVMLTQWHDAEASKDAQAKVDKARHKIRAALAELPTPLRIRTLFGFDAWQAECVWPESDGAREARASLKDIETLLDGTAEKDTEGREKRYQRRRGYRELLHLDNLAYRATMVFRDAGGNLGLSDKTDGPLAEFLKALHNRLPEHAQASSDVSFVRTNGKRVLNRLKR